MKLIVGLGNLGMLYKHSRHNIGIEIVSCLAREYKIKLIREKNALYKAGSGKSGAIDFILAVPLSFMNLSGVSVAALVKKCRVPLDSLLVICDDLDLALGSIRIRPSGSSAGHKGIKSIIERLESEAFARLRVGVGRPRRKEEVRGFVLSGFRRSELALMKEAREEACACVATWLEAGTKEAMNQFNRKRKEAE